MAKKTKSRTMKASIHLTAAAYKQLEATAFRNCRTVSQELTFMVERALEGQRAVTAIPRALAVPVAYDAPAQEPTQEYNPPAPDTTAAYPGVWTEAQEAEALAAGQAAGMKEAEVTALKLIHKTPEAVLAAIQAEVGATA